MTSTNLTSLLEKEIDTIYMNDSCSLIVIDYKNSTIELLLEDNNCGIEIKLLINNEIKYQYVISDSKALDIAVSKIEKLVN